MFSGEEIFGWLRSKISFAKEEFEKSVEAGRPPTDWESWLTAIGKDILDIQGNSHLWVIKERIKDNWPSLYQIKIGRGPWTTITSTVWEILSNTQKL